MTRDTREDDAFAVKKKPENGQRIVLNQVQDSTVEFWRMALNPLSYVPEPLLQVWVKVYPVLGAFVG